MAYQPPYSLSDEIVARVAAIQERVTRLSLQPGQETLLRLRRINRIRTITGSLAIEGNTLSEAQITALLEGKRVIAPPREILEAQNALAVYEHLGDWQPQREPDLLAAQQRMMAGLIDEVGRYRDGGVGVMSGKQVIHMAPPADRVGLLMADLFGWLARTEAHPLIASSVFHYEFEFIHPFADGNGRMGRLWQTLILARWQPVMADIPVESLVHQFQADYYRALQQSTAQTDSAPFILFMLQRIEQALDAVATPEVTPEVAPEVLRLAGAIQGEMSSGDLMRAMGLKDEKHFRQHYRQPALQQGVIEMTRPDAPRSSKQRYRLTALGERLKTQGKP